MKKSIKLLRRQNGYLLRAVAYFFCAVFCLSKISRMWILAIIFVLLTAFYFYQWWKHRSDLSLMEAIKKNLNGQEDDSDNYSELSKKEKKKSFQDYLSKIENDFQDEELDNAIEEAEDDEYSDLYTR